MSDKWKENAMRWRELYREATLDHGIPHTGETVQAESQFRALAEGDSEADSENVEVPVSDLERLTEALEWVQNDSNWLQTPHGWLVFVAARAYRDLLANGEREWHCEYPEFNDPNCQSGMGDPQPENTRQPRKHTQCRWVYLVDVPTTEEER